MTALALAASATDHEPGLALYDRMCAAIAECVRVDEAKDIRDKAMALEAYYRQARNLDAEREAANVRLRAERRVGELLKELARATPEEAGAQGGRGNVKSTSDDATGFKPISEQARCRAPSPYAAALSEQGMSRQQASRYQTLASIPEAQFERALSGPAKPTTAGVIRQTKNKATPRPTTVSREGTWLWGQLRDFENEGWFTKPLGNVLNGMTDAMKADVRRLIPQMQGFLTKLGGSL
jgi:hypothetical protein